MSQKDNVRSPSQVQPLGLVTEFAKLSVAGGAFRQRDTLPALGNDEIEQIRLCINKLSSEEYGHCSMTDLVEVVDE